MTARYPTMLLPSGKKQYVHRHVMEQYLGRPLLRSESVHHRSGDKWDYRIENLELWVTHQPSGQTVPDLIDHAIELLNRYMPELRRHHRIRVRRRLDQGVVDYLAGRTYIPEVHPDQLSLW